MPHGRVHRYENAGHYVLEDARDELRSLIVSFVSGASMATAS